MDQNEALLHILKGKGVKPLPPLYPALEIDEFVDLQQRIVVRLMDGRKYTIYQFELKAALTESKAPAKPKPAVKKD